MIPPLFLVALGCLPLASLLLWRFPRLPRATVVDAEVAVVIPARNEEHNLPRLLDSLAAQTLQAEEIIVVDDHSTDGTARVAALHGASVYTGRPLPEGWLGKPWACWQGAQRASRRILVFLDADTELAPTALERLAASLAAGGGLVSLWPYHRMERLYERLGAFFHLIVMASVRVFSIYGGRSVPSGAFGPCIACLRQDYLDLDGHRSVRGDILEDVVLGRRFSSAGHLVRLYAGRGVIAFRMYPDGIASLMRGFGKNLGSGAGVTSPLVLVLFAAWLTGASMTAYYAIESLFTGALRELWIPLVGLYGAQLFLILKRLGNYTVMTALLYPAPLLFFGCVTLFSLARTFLLGRVSWKGRTIELRGRK